MITTELAETTHSPPNRDIGDRPVEEILREITFGDQLSTEQTAALKDIVKRKAKAWGYANRTPANLPKLRTRLRLGFRVVKHMPARLSPKRRKIVHDWMVSLVKAGLYVRRDNNSWASRVTLVPKPDGSTRTCGNYVDVNAQCESDAGPMPDQRTKISTFRGCNFFATFDMENGFLQGELDELGQEVFAVVLDDGTYCPLRVPYGAKTHPFGFTMLWLGYS
jgi:hypothetical protein